MQLQVFCDRDRGQNHRRSHTRGLDPGRFGRARRRSERLSAVYVAERLGGQWSAARPRPSSVQWVSEFRVPPCDGISDACVTENVIKMSASESAFSDAEDDPVSRAGPYERKRPRSAEDTAKELEGKKQRFSSPKQPGKVSKSQRNEFLDDIRRMIDTSINGAVESLWERIDRKISMIDSKIDKLEGQMFERDQVIDELQGSLRVSKEKIAALEEQVEDLERHSRAANLIFWSEQLGKRTDGEDIAAMTVKLINDSFPTRTVSKQDFTAIHRLSKDNSVICCFVNKNLRNEIYAERLSLRSGRVSTKGRLFVSESLTRAKREVFSKLLDLKRKQVIWTAFTKNGIPCLKLLKESSPVRIFSLQQLDLVLQKVRPAGSPPPPPPPPAGGPWRGGEGRPPGGIGRVVS